MRPVRLILLLLPLLAACDQLKERAGIVDPVRQEAEGKAIGAACRQAGQGLEACFQDNADALKGAVFDGWKEMNEYMLKNNMHEQPPAEKEKKIDQSSDKPTEKAAGDKSADADRTAKKKER